jgi:hypothetical protein
LSQTKAAAVRFDSGVVSRAIQDDQKREATMNHELWLEPDGRQIFCLAGIHGEEARSLLHADAKLIWQVEAESYFEAMTRYLFAHGVG